MKKVAISVAFVAILIGILFIAFPTNHDPQPPTSPSTPALPESQIKYPISEPAPALEPPPAAEQPEPAPAPQPAQALPGLAEADEGLRGVISLLGDEKLFIELFHLDHFIQRFVVTIDNLPNKNLPRRQLPVKGAPDLFLVQGTKDNEVISPYNSRRYTRHIALAEALDSHALVGIYVRNYPLFQKAYTDLGHPDAYFNDRLVEVIDHLLETPEVKEPIRLERPAILYQFADPELESRSAGQKILLRIGSDNAAKIKTKLRELRAELMTQVVR